MIAGRRKLIFLIRFIFLITAIFGVLDVSAQIQPEKIEAGETVERSIKGGESHVFEFQLEKGFYARAETVPQGIDLVLTLFAPDGKIVAGMDGDSGFIWRESVSVIAENGGIYKVQVAGKGNPKNAGSYTLKISKPHISDFDQKRIEAERNLTEGISLLKNADANSVGFLENSLALWREIGADKFWEAVTLRNLAWAHFFAGNAEKAFESQNQALKIFVEIGDRYGEALALSGVGNLYAGREDYEKAREYFEKSLAIRRELKKTDSEFYTLQSLVGIYEALKLTGKIFESLERMLVISRELEDRAGERDTLYLLGLYNFGEKAEQLGKAAVYLEQALAIDRELNDAAAQFEKLIYLGFIYGQLLQYEKGEKSLFEALEVAKKLGDKAAEGKALAHLGTIFMSNSRDCEKSRDFFARALILNQETGNKAGEANVHSNLATIYLCLGDNPKTIENSEKSLNLYRELGDKIGQITTLTALAGAHNNVGKIDEAQAFYEEALRIARAENLKIFEINALGMLANNYSFQQEYAKAAELYKEALALARGINDDALTALMAGGLALTYFNLKEFEKSLALYEETLGLYRKLNDKNQESGALQSLGIWYENQNDFEKAREFYEQSLKIAEEQGNSSQTVYILSSIGSLHYRQNDYEEGIKFQEKALELARKAKNGYWEVSLLNNLGSAYARINNNEKAQKYLEQALLKARNETKNRISEAVALLVLGDVYFKLNKYEKARDNYELGLKISREIKNKEIQSISSAGIGSVFADLSQSQRAQGNFEQSLAISKELLDRRGESNILNSLGNIYLALGENGKAREFYEKSLAIAEELGENGLKVYPLINLGLIFQNENKLDKAFENYETGLALALETKDKNAETYALGGLGGVSFLRGEYAKSEEFYLKALANAAVIESKKLEGGMLWGLMELFKKQGKPQSAIFYGKQAVNRFQEIRSGLKTFDEQTQQSYLKNKETAYRTLADLLISQGRFPEAQLILDLLKTEEYEKLTATRSGAGENTVPYSGAEREVVEKIENLARLERRKTELLREKQDAGANFPADKQKELTDAYAGIEAANKAFRETLSQLSKTSESAENRVSEIQSERSLQRGLKELSRELDTGVVAIYTLIGTNTETENAGAKFGWAILVTPDSRKAYPINVENLEQTVFQFRDALSSDKYDPQILAEKIYDRIFRTTSENQKQTLEADLNEYFSKYPNKTIMWSLDGVLRYIPMAALHDGGEYLVNKYQHIVFSKQSVPYLNDKDAPDWKILGLGVSEKRLDFAPLPGVVKELKDIIKENAATGGIFDGTIRLNDEFKKDEVFSLWREGEFPVVHIASHFNFDPADQTASFLLVGDGKMTFADIKDKDNLFGAVDLLTLSACDTAMSDNGREAEGFAILAQELGAKSVIASLWKVSDAGTPELMIRFYKTRRENPNMPKGEAFRKSQLAMLDANSSGKTDGKRSGVLDLSGNKKIELPAYKKDAAKPFAHPHYWAAFVLIGNWR